MPRLVRGQIGDGKTDVYIGELVLDGLEGADRSAELTAVQCMPHRETQLLGHHPQHFLSQ